ncbi:molybdate ABC transporter substrate-binding protein [Vibrio kyushuensis]|uniref:molybdate ABC transporter substrate-binding protein n=1 Tax=Vibrio kyushuensis TaxID=2910249 RepID=UPI003D0D5F9D
MLIKWNKFGAVWRLISVFMLTFITAIPASFAKEKVTIFAASSLTNALSEIADEYQQQHQVTIRLSFASSSALARQITYGAPADIYFPANQKWLDYVIEQQAVDADSSVTLLNNSLVLIVPVNQGVGEKIEGAAKSWDLVNLLNGGRLAVGDPDHVPVGQYAKQALEHYEQWESVKSHLARANNVRGALVLVERGESPLGIVYQTDAMISSKVKSIATFSSVSHQNIEYPMVMVSEKPTPESQKFYQYLQSDEAKAVFLAHGFGVN